MAGQSDSILLVERKPESAEGTPESGVPFALATRAGSPHGRASCVKSWLRVPVEFMGIAEQRKFGAVIDFPMTFWLTLDVGNGFAPLRRADGELSITVLPGEGAAFWKRAPEPTAGKEFHLFDGSGWGEIGRKREKEVNVIVARSCCQLPGAGKFGGVGQEGIKLGRGTHGKFHRIWRDGDHAMYDVGMKV